MEEERCEHCGAKMKRYWHRITPGLVKVLSKCYKNVSEKKENVFQMKDLQLNNSEFGNFQKLRFHALIAKNKENGEIQSREWVITKRGADFIRGLVQIPVRVQTFRNQVIDHDTTLVGVDEVMRDVEYWEKDFDYDIAETQQGRMI